MAYFWLVCSGKIPGKSNKLALIEGKTFNLMFLVIPVVPIENWLRLTHNQSRKTLKVAALFLGTGQKVSGGGPEQRGGGS